MAVMEPRLWNESDAAVKPLGRTPSRQKRLSIDNAVPVDTSVSTTMQERPHSRGLAAAAGQHFQAASPTGGELTAARLVSRCLSCASVRCSLLLLPLGATLFWCRSWQAWAVILLAFLLGVSAAYEEISDDDR